MTVNIYNIFIIIMIVIKCVVLHFVSLNILLISPHGYTVYALYLVNGGMDRNLTMFQNYELSAK